MNGNRFVIHRLRAHPVEYSVELRHYVADDNWMFGVTVKDVDIAASPEEARRVASDLRYAADMIEKDADD